MTQQESVWNNSPSLKSYTLANFRTLPQVQNLSEETQFEMEVVGNVLPFKANNYVVEQLINWNNIPIFPMKGIIVKNDKISSDLIADFTINNRLRGR